MRVLHNPIVRRAPVDWILARMTDLGESDAALHFGCVPYDWGRPIGQAAFRIRSALAKSFAIRGSIVQCAVSMKLCECGCGKPAPLAKFTNKRFGYVKGQRVRFIKGHNFRQRLSKPHETIAA
jgi:hypothetical protein